MHKRMLQSPPFSIESCPELNAQTDASVTTFLYWILSWVECTNGCFSHHLSLLNPILSWMHKQMLQSPPFSIESCPELNAQTDASVTTFLYWILSWVECTNGCFSHHLSLFNPILSWMHKRMLQSPPFSIESYPELNAQTDASVTTFLYWILSWVECTNRCFSHHLSLFNPILSWMHKRMLQSPPFSIESCPELNAQTDASVTTFLYLTLSWVECTNGCFSHHLSLLNPILSWMHKQMLQSPPFSIESYPELNAQTDASVTTFLYWILSWVECTNGCFSHHLSLLNPVLSWMHKRMLQSPPFSIESYPELNAQTDATVTTFLYWILSWVECTNGCFSHHLSLLNPILSWMHKRMLQSPPFSIESYPELNAQTDASVTTFLYWILSWVECTNGCFSHHLSLLNPVLSWMHKRMLQSPPFSIESYPELNAQTDATVTTFLYWILSWVECTNGCYSHHLSLLNPILSWMHKRMLQSPPFSIESYLELNAQTDATVTTFLYWILSWVECTNGCYSHHLSLLNPILSWMHKRMLQSPPFSIESYLELNAQTDASVTTFLCWILSWVECTNGCFSHHLSLLNPVLSWMHKRMLQSPPFSIESCLELNAQTDATVTTFLYWILSWVECTNGCFSHHLSLLNPVLSWMHKWILQSPPFSIESCLELNPGGRQYTAVSSDVIQPHLSRPPSSSLPLCLALQHLLEDTGDVSLVSHIIPHPI